MLQSNGMAIRVDPSEGAYPSGLTSTAAAAHTLYLLTGSDATSGRPARRCGVVAAQAVETPSAFGAALELMSALAEEPEQLVVVLRPAGRRTPAWSTPCAAGRPVWWPSSTGGRRAAFAADGFELFEARIDGGRPGDGVPLPRLRLPAAGDDPAALG